MQAKGKPLSKFDHGYSSSEELEFVPKGYKTKPS